MQLHRAQRLLSLRRLNVCRRLFADPWTAHFRLAFIRNKPFELQLQNGRWVTFTRRDKSFWYWVLDGNNPLEFTPEGLLAVRFEQLNLLLRPGTRDFSILREVFQDDQYSLGSLRRPLQNVLDLGANIGLFTCAALSRCKRVVAVEPVSDNYHMACRNVARNNGNPADVLHFAVAGRSNSAVRIYHHSKHSGAHSMFDTAVEGDGSYEVTPAISLTDLLDRTAFDSVDLLKCDVEGAEYEIFLSTPPEILSRIGRIVMEVHIWPLLPPTLFQKLMDHLKNSGFKLVSRRGTEQSSLPRKTSFILEAARAVE